MSGGGSSGTQNTTATPWAGIQPSLNSFYANAANAWNNGQIAPAQNTGQVAPWNSDLNKAYYQALGGNQLASNLTQDLASGNIGGSGNVGAMGLQNIINGNFGNGAGAALSGIANGNFANNAATSGLSSLAAGNYGGNAATAGLLSTANGAGLNVNTPALQGAIQAANQPVVQNYQQAVLPGLLSTFSANGRLGSGANMSAIGQSESQLGQTLANNAGTLTNNAYQNALQQQLTAQGTLAGLTSNAGNTLLGGQLNAGSTLGSLTNSASQNLGALQGNALSAVPGMTSANLGVAGGLQSYLQSVLNSNITQQNYNNNLPLLALQNMEGLLNPGLSLTGQSSHSSQSNAANPFGLALGGAATGAAIGSAVPGIGTAIGAGVGGLAGLLGGYL